MGLVKLFVKRLKEVARLVSSEKDWARDIARIQASINHSWHSSPSSLLFGYTPRLYRGAPSVELIVDECWEEHFLRVESDLARASVNLGKRNKELVIRFNRFRGNSDFSLGDMVHVDTSNLPSPTPYAFRKR